MRSSLARVDRATDRPFRDADVYVTCAQHSSASLGWHIDDIDVLLVMLRGTKRFRVAGKALGSAVSVDHVMRPGDAIFIPAGCFHSGGCADASGDSTLLSLALPPADADAAATATDAVNRWKAARQLILERAPSRCLEWEVAGSVSGRAAIRDACVGSAGTLVGPFLLNE